MNENELRDKGLALAADMLGEEVSSALKASVGSKAFGAFRGDMALRHVFGELWTRPGLDRRGRSLLTLGILIARGQTTEMKIHLLTAIRNGCTVEEIEEAIYHSAAYAGFPASNEAAIVAEQVFRSAGLIE